MTRLFLLSTCILFLSGCVQQQVRNQMNDSETLTPSHSHNTANLKESDLDTIATITPSHFHNTANLKDSDLDTIATIDTSNGFVVKAGLLGKTNFDMHLKAAIDKKTGKTLVGVNSFVRYRQSTWAHYYSANYETPTGPKIANLKRTHTDVSCTGSRYRGCTYLEMMSMYISEFDLRRIAADADVTGKKMWNMKLNSRTGEKRVVMSMAEIKGFLMALDDYRDGNNIKITQID